LRITALPARAPNASIEVSYLLEAGGVRLLHAGDTATHRHFEEIAGRCSPEIALLPVNGVSFFGVRLTMTPEEAAEAARRLGVRVAIPMHAEMSFTRLSGLFYRARGTPEAFERALARLAPGVHAFVAPKGVEVPLALPHGLG
jgi:L-ascorbate metabolism protein UlaG (beta-lactamase superfamily)